MLSLMDYSILNASGELSPPQFLHIHVAVCLNKKTPEGAYAGCVGLRKNYGYVGWKWKLSSVCNKCMQERRRCSVKD